MAALSALGIVAVIVVPLSLESTCKVPYGFPVPSSGAKTDRNTSATHAAITAIAYRLEALAKICVSENRSNRPPP